jgi:hypothetical protein
VLLLALRALQRGLGNVVSRFLDFIVKLLRMTPDRPKDEHELFVVEPARFDVIAGRPVLVRRK